MPEKWNSVNETKLLLTLLAHYSRGQGSPRWDEVAALMGEGFTAGAVSQHYMKKLMKREPFVAAKTAFSSDSFPAVNRIAISGSSPTKKRKIDNAAQPKTEDDWTWRYVRVSINLPLVHNISSQMVEDLVQCITNELTIPLWVFLTTLFDYWNQ